MIYDHGNKKLITAVISILFIVMGTIIFSRVLWYLCGKGQYESNFFIVYSPTFIGSVVLYLLLSISAVISKYKNKVNVALGFVKAITGVLSLNLAYSGYLAIRDKDIILNFDHYSGTDAVNYGIFLIVFSVFVIAFWWLGPLLGKKLMKLPKTD